MKKILLASALVLSAVAFGQRLQNSEIQLNAGFAADRYAGNVAFYGGLDYGLMNDISLGAEIRVGSKDYDYDGYENGRGNWIGVGFNGNYHFNTLLKIPNQWDFYAGVTLGFNSFKYDYPSNWNAHGIKDPHDNGFGVSAQVGGRYYFNNNFGVNVEANAGSLFNGGKAGITYKF